MKESDTVRPTFTAWALRFVNRKIAELQPYFVERVWGDRENFSPAFARIHARLTVAQAYLTDRLQREADLL